MKKKYVSVKIEYLENEWEVGYSGMHIVFAKKTNVQVNFEASSYEEGSCRELF
jgi:hypothetical protein